MTVPAQTPALTRLGFRTLWAGERLEPGQLFARVARVERGRAWLWSEQGDLELDLALYEQPHDVAVGDWMAVQPTPGQVLPVRRLARFSCIARRAAGERADRQLIAANVDTLFLVSSCNQDFSPERLERYLAVALEAGVTPVIVLSKADMTDDPERYAEQARALGRDLEVLTLDARESAAVGPLSRWCGTGQTVALIGSSGVGKSTLTNLLIGDAVQPTQDAREDDAKGRHTTTSRSMHALAGGGLIIDTPGMRELQLPACEQGLESLFADVLRHLGRCRFNDCQHAQEPGCAVREAIEAGVLDERRWRSYQALLEEQSRNAVSMAQRGESARKLTRSYRQYQKHARGNKGRKS